MGQQGTPFVLSLSKGFPIFSGQEKEWASTGSASNGCCWVLTMSIGPRLDLRQSQSLVMTPQLQQAIRLLALSNLEIESFIAEELEKNPLLDSGGGDDEANAESRRARGRRARRAASRRRSTCWSPAAAAMRRSTSIPPTRISTRTAPPTGRPEGGGLDGGGLADGLDGIASGSGEGADFDSFAGASVSLHDHLLAQAGESLSGTDLIIAAQIIEQIDETGYFLASLLDIAHRLEAPVGEVERVLRDGPDASTRPESAPARSPNAWPSRRRRPTATIRRWRG